MGNTEKETDRKIPPATSLGYDVPLLPSISRERLLELRDAAYELLIENAFGIMASLIHISKIDLSEEIGSAGLARMGNVYHIYFNGQFVATYANTPEKFASLWAHELLHHALRHTRRFHLHGQVENFAQDVIIQSILFKISSERLDMTSFFRDFYRPEGIGQLLRPPPLDFILGQEECERILLEDGPLGEIWEENYYRYQTEQDIINFLYAEGRVEESETVFLIGNHEEDDQGKDKEGAGDKTSKDEKSGNKKKAPGPEDQPGESPIGRDTAREILEECHQIGRGNNPLVERYLDSLRPNSIPKEVLDAIRNNTWVSIQQDIVRDILGPTPHARRSVLPSNTMTRSEQLQIATGYWPGMFRHEKPDFGKPCARSYIDVSGSMDCYMKWLYGVILKMGESVVMDPVLFSTHLAPVTMDQIREGYVSSGGGTEVDLCLQDLLSQPKDLLLTLLFSDGDFNASSKLVRAVQQQNRKIFGILFCGYNQDIENTKQYKAMAQLCEKVYIIPDDISTSY